MLPQQGPRNANDVEHVAGRMSNGGNECLMGTGGSKGERGFAFAASRASSCATSSGRCFAPDIMGMLTYFPIREQGGLATGVALIFLGDHERRDGEV